MLLIFLSLSDISLILSIKLLKLFYIVQNSRFNITLMVGQHTKSHRDTNTHDQTVASENRG